MLKIGVFWRRFRNIEQQQNLSKDKLHDDAYQEAYEHYVAIKEAGFDASLIEWKKDPRETLKTVKRDDIDLVFNASSVRELAFLETFGIPYVGSSIDLVASNKVTRKEIVAYHQLPTPRFVIAESPKRIPEHKLKYPLFVKPVKGRGSAGISEENIIQKEEDLSRVVAKITEGIGQPALIEEFIEGRELTVGIVGYYEPKILPLLEIQYNDAKTNTFEHKMGDNEIIHCPARFSKDEEEIIKETAFNIFKVLNAKDFARIDMILGKDGVPYFLELNTFAGLAMTTGKAHSGYMGYIAEAAGMTAKEFIGSIVESAIERYRSLVSTKKIS